MKRMLLLMTLSIAIFPYCTKEARACYVCNNKTYISSSGSSPTVVESKSDLCDKTQDEINDYQKSATKIVTQNGTSYSSVVTCQKK